VYCPGGIDHVEPRVDPFYSISVEIDNKSSLSAALEAFFQKETISDFFCGKCKRQVQVEKQLKIKSLPQTLIVHLKRFKFSVAEQTRAKLTHEVSYPLKLDLKKMCMNVTDTMSYEYELKGVVVHTGTAEGGHYHCLIKERTNSSSIPNECRWYGRSFIFMCLS